ncbi:MAG TPA: hypothetical protein VKV26_16435 [Dehalococcoidia bacterium]|nr:hypothetical protein [Dehalococcoidia bacterium]
MSVLGRLFGNRRRRREQAAAGAGTPPSIGQEAPAPEPAEIEPSLAESDRAGATGAEPAAHAGQAAAETPLRSLQRYRHDPAFKNFMAKAQKPPGAVRRTNLPPDAFDREQRR